MLNRSCNRAVPFVVVLDLLGQLCNWDLHMAADQPEIIMYPTERTSLTAATCCAQGHAPSAAAILSAPGSNL